MTSSLLLMIHVLSACLGGLYGLECYSCSYDNSIPDYMPNCNDPIDVSDPSISETVMSCDGVCAKSSIVVGNITAVSRECLRDMTVAKCDNECNTSDEEGTLCFHCCDDADRCNGAVSMTYDLLTSFTVFAFSFYWTVS